MWRPAALAPAVDRHDRQHRVPADGLAGVRRGAAGARQDLGHRRAGRCFAQALNTVVAFVLTTTVFALIYKLMPRAKIEWHDVWVGAAVTAVLFTLGKFLISFYIGRSAVASSFGAAGSLAVVMIWVYYSAQIFLLGAEFTWVYAHSHGSRKGQLRARRAREKCRLPMDLPAPAPRRATARANRRQHVPVRKRNPVVIFGIAAALGSIAGLLSRSQIALNSHSAILPDHGRRKGCCRGSRARHLRRPRPTTSLPRSRSATSSAAVAALVVDTTAHLRKALNGAAARRSRLPPRRQPQGRESAARPAVRATPPGTTSTARARSCAGAATPSA